MNRCFIRKSLSILTLVAATAAAMGQADFPTLKGTNQRIGSNTDPAVGSEQTNLRWFSPIALNATNTIAIDNTTQAGAYGIPTTQTTNISVFAPATNGWFAPPNDTYQATGTYDVTATDAAGVPTPTAGVRQPTYEYATCVPSAVGSDPRIPQSGGLKTWDWIVEAPNPTPQFYAIYVNIPIGLTAISPDGAARRYPQRYFVYEITYGSGQKRVDVVDTYQSGYGRVRLGNNGLATDATFLYDGTNPIRVRLFNTVPRDTAGNLLLDRGVSPANVLVYADAVIAQPLNGVYTASPTSPFVYTNPADTTTVLPTVSDRDVLTGAGATGLAFRMTAAQNTFAGTLAQLGSTTTNDTFQAITRGTVTCWQPNPDLWPNPPTGVPNQPGSTTGTPYSFWQYSPLDVSESAITLDNGGTGVTPSQNWTPSAATTTVTHIGADYLTAAPVAGTATTDATETVLYAPDLNDGNYEIYAYLPGDGTTETYGQAVLYGIYQGGTLVDTITVNQATARGWTRLGTRRYVASRTSSLPLTVRVTNVSNGDEGSARRVYADAVRFVGNSSLAITSTPIHATVNIKDTAGNLTPKQVVIVADERGRLHCLDLLGRSDGTTLEYWSYPSTPNQNNPNWQDPNLGAGPEGTYNNVTKRYYGPDGSYDPTVPYTQNAPTAIMPSGFDLSSALVQRVGTNDYLYIASTNGRVYCIDMAGRGDYSDQQRVVGTTTRVWTFPNDYNPQTPNSPVATRGLLGDQTVFRGSLVYGDTTNGAPGPTIYVPAPEGRLYALDATGDTTTKRTTVRWAFPGTTQTAIAPIEVTPALAFGQLYFGTLVDDNTGRGTFYAINASSGARTWFFDGATVPAGAQTGSSEITPETVTSFTSGPATASATLLNNTTQFERQATTTYGTYVDTVYALNGNGYFYGFNAATGRFVTTNAANGSRPYRTNELQISSTQNLGVTALRVYGNSGVLTTLPVPVVTVPSNQYGFYAFYARPDDYNINSSDLLNTNPPIADPVTSFSAYGRSTTGANVTSLAFSNRRLFAADDAGYVYQFDADLQGYGTGFTGAYGNPSYQDISRNDPLNRLLSKAQIDLLSRAGYVLLRNGNADYNTFFDTNGQPKTGTGYFDVQPPAEANGVYAFDWGQTIYLVLHEFPYQLVDENGNPTQNVVADVTFNVGGKVVPRTVSATLQFLNAPPFNDPNVPDLNGYKRDGYAVLSFPLQNAGGNFLPPGPGTMSVSLRTVGAGAQATNRTNLNVGAQVFSDPRTNSPSRRQFIIDNPIGVGVVSLLNNQTYGLGALGDPYAKENQVNGSPDLGSTPTTYENQLFASAGYTQHGSAANANVYLYDRSLMTVLRGPGHGLDNVRMDRATLGWEGMDATRIGVLNTNLFPGFEDEPLNSPNTSLDYPDIAREQITFTKDPNGSAENPLQNGVTLIPPTLQNGAAIDEDTPAVDRNARAVQPTPVRITVDVPQFQPPVNTNALGTTGAVDNLTDRTQARHNSVGRVEPQGYVGRIRAYVDSQANGQLDTVNTIEAYRSFNFAVGVVPDYRLRVGTPNVDLGTLAAGTNYAPQNPGQAADPTTHLGGDFSPWLYSNANPRGYRPFQVLNEGNVNATDVRLVKATNIQFNNNGTVQAGSFQPWDLNPRTNDPLAYLDATLNLWSTLDPELATPITATGGTSYRAVIQKARVTDRVPTSLDVNPHPRANPNTGATGDSLNVVNKAVINGNLAYTPGQPVVGVSVPIGTPVGTYQSQLLVMNKLTSNANPYTNSNSVWQPYDFSGTVTPEPYSDPGLTLTFTVGETRLTNSTSSLTTPMVDNGLDRVPDPNNAGQTIPATFTFANATPAAMRATDGSLIAAWASNRPAMGSAPTNQASNANTYKIYIAGLATNASFGANAYTPPGGGNPNTPLSDLNYWAPNSNDQWFRTQTPTGYPTASQFGAGVVTGTESYGSPAFPVRGESDPLNRTATSQDTYMAFVGQAQVTTGSGRLAQSNVFLSPVRAAGGTATLGDPIAVREDLLTTKTRPSVVKVEATAGGSRGALVFYGVTSGGQSRIHMSRLLSGQNGFGVPITLNFGQGFDSTSDPSVTLRPYSGALPQPTTAAQIPDDGQWSTPQVLELTFSGRLRGRPTSDVFLGRMRVGVPRQADAQHPPIVANGVNSYEAGQAQPVDAQGFSLETQNAGTGFSYMPVQTNELLIAEGSGVYRAKGVVWDRRVTPGLREYGGNLGANGVDLLIPGTQNFDRASGLISYDTRLGGKVYFDPSLGTVRFTNGVPAPGITLRLTYRPTFLRVSSGVNATYSTPTGLFDDRFIPNYATSTGGATYYPFWFTGTGTPALVTPATRKANGEAVTNDRFVFTYGRGATGNGQTTRPYMTTMRFGVRLPTPVYTDQNAAETLNRYITVSGATGPFEVDPANARVYFTAADEDRQVTITYTGVDGATRAPIAGIPVTANVSLIAETPETAIPMEGAVNESGLTTFMDPFSYTPNAAGNFRNERPNLFWLFYTSTRYGAPDVFFQTIAPRLIPVVPTG